MAFVIIIDRPEEDCSYAITDYGEELVRFDSFGEAMDYINEYPQYGNYFYILDLDTGDIDEL